MTLIDKLALPEKYIPQGHYCYDQTFTKPCPFWESKKGEYPKQEDGYCHFLGKSDWDHNEESGGSSKIIYCDDEEIVGMTIAELTKDDEEEIDPISGKKIHFTSSLMWDMVKECGVNMEESDDTEITQYNSATGKTTHTTAGELKKAKS